MSRSGFYQRRDRPTSATAARRELLKTKIQALFDAHRCTYGHRRLHAALLLAVSRSAPSWSAG